MAKSKWTWKNPPRRFYVYEWFRIEDNHVFYVGKGSGGRAARSSPKSRNPYFCNYIKKHKCDYRIIKDDLTEKEAYILENEYCQKYKALDQCECNISDTSCCNGGSGLKGALNGMYGKTHTPEVREYLRQVNLDGHNAGENNSQYGISPADRMSPERYKIWRAKQRARKDGQSNPNAHGVLMIDINTKKYKQFDAIIDCQKYIQENEPALAQRYDSLEKIRYMIKHSNKTNAIYNNLVFKIYNKKNPINIDDTVSSLEAREIRKIPPYSRKM